MLLTLPVPITFDGCSGHVARLPKPMRNNGFYQSFTGAIGLAIDALRKVSALEPPAPVTRAPRHP